MIACDNFLYGFKGALAVRRALSSQQPETPSCGDQRYTSALSTLRPTGRTALEYREDGGVASEGGQMELNAGRLGADLQVIASRE
jgi:hypothetical protein